MTRLEAARTAYDAARAEYRSALAAELTALGESFPLTTSPPKAPPPPQPRPAMASKPQKPAKNAKKIGTETCGHCGRTGLFKALGRGANGLLGFHYCEKGLPCAGGKLGSATPEDLKAGKHSKSACQKCDARVVYK